MKQYIARRRNTPRLGKDARNRILAQVIGVAPPDATLPAVVAREGVNGRIGHGFNVPRIVDVWNDMAHISVNE
ncbi:MAG TPA: hypothetical protein VIN17_08175, partial [Paracoccaceae bacterium]